MNLKKIITISTAILMMASAGASVSNITSNPVHASRVSTLRNKMNKDYKEAHHYNNLGNQIKREINKLSHSNKRNHKSHNKVFRQGMIDGYSDCGKGRSFITKKYVHNKQYQAGFVYALMHNHLHVSRKEAKTYFKNDSLNPNSPAKPSDELHY